ncbi:MAG: transglycosylase domain-containing protein [Firmicutes bacterium]|nr:transglycosylase domain-containing protein [Bacillota bacterium]MBE3590601.1 transglycosylase domain-containing protein [Bacillota bacterium]
MLSEAESSRQAPRPRRRRWALWAAAGILLAGTWTGLVFWQTYAPQVNQLESIVQHQVLVNGGSYVPLERIAPEMRAAVVAAEDRTFYRNWGVSWTGIGRALIVDIVSLEYAEGGSTITQQLARETLLTREKTLRRKLKEIALAVMITRTYPKDKILEMYLNAVYFGHGAYGVEAAAETYFAKPAAALTLAQSALLAGVLQGPSLYDPFCNLDGARARERYVLEQMVETGAITPEQGDAAWNAPLYLIPGSCFPSAGGAQRSRA